MQIGLPEHAGSRLCALVGVSAARRIPALPEIPCTPQAAAGQHLYTCKLPCKGFCSVKAMCNTYLKSSFRHPHCTAQNGGIVGIKSCYTTNSLHPLLQESNCFHLDAIPEQLKAVTCCSNMCGHLLLRQPHLISMHHLALMLQVVCKCCLARVLDCNICLLRALHLLPAKLGLLHRTELLSCMYAARICLRFAAISQAFSAVLSALEPALEL